MPFYIRFSRVLLLALSVAPHWHSFRTLAQTTTPLIDKHYAYPSQIPYQVDPVDGERGPQQGYNICNATTQNQQSECQTSFLNSISDFCLWAPPTPNSTIADTEGIEVAWCTQPGHGTRVIPDGALQGVQFMRTPDYIQVVGFIDQSMVNMFPDDAGGELDPHGADMRGNPLGALVYSNGFSNNTNNGTYEQVIEWNNFMGEGTFCFKACNPAGPNAVEFCQHSYDRIGCEYNAPNNGQNGTFESCDGDDQDYVGIYTSDGQVMTYNQPDTSLGPITTIPYQPRVPASSNCVTYSSQDLYAVTTPISAASPTMTTISSLPSSAVISRSGTRSHTTSTSDGSTDVLGMSFILGLLGVGFAVMFLS